jgi:hypothetical protein
MSPRWTSTATSWASRSGDGGLTPARAHSAAIFSASRSCRRSASPARLARRTSACPASSSARAPRTCASASPSRSRMPHSASRASSSTAPSSGGASIGGLDRARGGDALTATKRKISKGLTGGVTSSPFERARAVSSRSWISSGVKRETSALASAEPCGWRWTSRSTRPRPSWASMRAAQLLLGGEAPKGWRILDLEEALIDRAQLDPEDLRLPVDRDDPGRSAETSHAPQRHPALLSALGPGPQAPQR